MDIRGQFCAVKGVRHWERSLGEGGDHPSLEVFNARAWSKLG